MADKPGKYAAALASVIEPAAQERPAGILLPEKPPPPTGKRRLPGWNQRALLLKDDSVDAARARLKKRGDGMDFSDLMQALLENWLATPE